MSKIAVIRIRGTVNLKREIKDTLKMLRLERPHYCTILEDTESYRGMLQKVKDYVTFGEIDKETFKKLLLKWGRAPGNKRIDEKYIKERTGKIADDFIDRFFESEMNFDDIGIKKVFRLHPPSKGYRKVRLGYEQGGSSGYRGKNIISLLTRII
ncbi:MAG: 50S ribosomal protein L30 [Euryarchaeota archaeon]|nr:50S ribosomal protein L30 [Euryarchaeota archaeon]